SRLDGSGRQTRQQRREGYLARMDAKAAARAELEREREAGLWADDADDANAADPDAGSGADD
ncbi:MAG TPA: GTPase ObgE, partial [Terrimesophilobacter sp.]|nr:GTPase ObgE [Terrimesophilobacter sp.]